MLLWSIVDCGADSILELVRRERTTTITMLARPRQLIGSDAQGILILVRSILEVRWCQAALLCEKRACPPMYLAGIVLHIQAAKRLRAA